MQGGKFMEQMSDYTQLNEFICWVIQQNGITYVVDNYIAIREEFYCNRSTSYT